MQKHTARHDSQNAFFRVKLAACLACCLCLAPSTGAFAEDSSEEAGPPPVDHEQRIREAKQSLEAERDVTEARLALGQSYYYLSVFEDKKASKRANQKSLKHLGWLLERSPEDPIVLVYHGASELIKSKHAWAPWDKGNIAKSGLKKMLEAGELSKGTQEHVHVIAVRGVATFHLPEIFEYRDESKADLAAAAPLVRDAWLGGRITANLAAATLYYHGRMLEEDGQVAAARDAYEQAIGITDQTRAGRDANAALEKLE